MPTKEETKLQRDDDLSSRFGFRLGSFYVAFCFSIIYFAETPIRASEKRFWFDELATTSVACLAFMILGRRCYMERTITLRCFTWSSEPIWRFSVLA